MKKHFTLLSSALLMLSLTLTGCSSSGDTTGTTGGTTTSPDSSTSTPADTADLGKAACVLGIGGLGDQSYNDLAYAGMLQAEAELGVPFDYAEPSQLSDFEPIIRDMATSGEYGVIVCVGFDAIDPLIAVSADFPDQKFALIDGEVEAANVANYTYKEEEGSFLVGVLAGLMQKNPEAYGMEGTGTISFIAAMEIPLLVKFNAGYQAGAKLVNPDIEILTDYVGGSNPFNDTTTAKEITLSQNNRGSELVFNVAGGSGLGIFQAADEGGFYAIGCNSNQNVLDPDTIVMSMMKQVDVTAFEIVKAAHVDDALAVGGTTIMDVANGGCGYAVEGSDIEYLAEDIAIVEDFMAQIAAGDLVIPSVMEDVDAFLANTTF
ncbi:MAG: BMP family ABC transporter substrate-binding protein [Eubacteriales bacterium]